MNSDNVTPTIDCEMRKADEKDLEKLLALYKQLNPSNLPLELNERATEIWNQILHDKRLFCFVLTSESDLLASCVLDIVPNLTRSGKPFGVLQNVITDSKYRRFGLGGRLVKETLEFA